MTTLCLILAVVCVGGISIVAVVCMWRLMRYADAMNAKTQGLYIQKRSDCERLQKDITAINAERVRLQTAVDVAREGRDAAEATAREKVQAEMAKLRSKIAELEKDNIELHDHLDSERNSYHTELTGVGGEVMELHRENKRLKEKLASIGIKPPKVQAAEHDDVGAIPTADFIKPVEHRFQTRRTPRVRDDEAND